MNKLYLTIKFYLFITSLLLLGSCTDQTNSKDVQQSTKDIKKEVIGEWQLFAHYSNNFGINTGQTGDAKYDEVFPKQHLVITADSIWHMEFPEFASYEGHPYQIVDDSLITDGLPGNSKIELHGDILDVVETDSYESFVSYYKSVDLDQNQVEHLKRYRVDWSKLNQVWDRRKMSMEPLILCNFDIPDTLDLTSSNTENFRVSGDTLYYREIEKWQRLFFLIHSIGQVTTYHKCNQCEYLNSRNLFYYKKAHE